MALKALVASKAALAEDAIEAIVADYVRYDVDEKEIALTPAGSALAAKAKILVYLVALQGWPFLIKEAIPTDASPAEIGTHLGIPGGTIRPMLMDLRDRHLLTGKGGRYSVRAANLDAIKAELQGTGSARRRARRSTGPQKSAKSAKSTSTKSTASTKESRSGSRGGRKPKLGKSGSHQARFDAWINDGFFDQSRTMVDVQKKFHQAGIIIRRTSIPQLLLKAVRDERLSRHEAEVAGKNVWAYQRAK